MFASFSYLHTFVLQYDTYQNTNQVRNLRNLASITALIKDAQEGKNFKAFYNNVEIHCI